MEKIKINYKELISFCLLFIIGCIMLFIGMAFVGNQAQVYNDIIIETVCSIVSYIVKYGFSFSAVT